MRKARTKETPESGSIAADSRAKSVTRIASKGASTDGRDRHGEERAKIAKTSKTSSTRNGETDRRSSVNVASRSKAAATPRPGVTSSTRGTTRSSTKTAAKSSVDVSESRREKKKDSEKRGTSTIYLPKTSVSRKNVKTLEPGRVSKTDISATSKNGSEKKVASERDGRAAVASKDRYSGGRRVSSRERRRSRTLSPSEVKVLHSRGQIPGGSAKKATLSQARSSKEKEMDARGKNVSDEDYAYEDDFEDYESDFEECTDSAESEISEIMHKNPNDEITGQEPIVLQTEKQDIAIKSVDIAKKPDEDRMLDSGHYELAEARRRAAKIETITLTRDSKSSETETAIGRSIVSPYREERSIGENKSLPSSMDEGFEDSRSGDFAKSPPLSRVAIIDFRKTPKSNEATKCPTKKAVTRGEQLLRMIKLDVVEWSILESKPVAYEEFIRTHGKLNTRQICVQTNEDNLDAETQTDRIECTNKWTQFPAKCTTSLRTDDDVKLFSTECRGVGGDDDDDFRSIKQTTRPIYDVLRLNEFLAQAGRVMLSLLEERTIGNSASVDDANDSPFSEGRVELSIDTVTFLAGRPVTIIHYSNVSNRLLLTIHAPVDEEIETPRDEDFVTDCSIGCTWNILQPSRPMKIFYSPSAITCCCFHLTSYNVALAGLEDGSISLWDLGEDETWHRKIIDRANKCEWIVRSPTYSSAGNFEASGHDSEIVALRVLSKIENEHDQSSSKKFMPIQISSLDANGRLIVWSVLRNMSRASIDDLGSSWWGHLRLVKSQEISLDCKKASQRTKDLRGFSDMHVDPLDTNALYIATNTSDILHANRMGKRANPPAYKSNEIDWCGPTKCIENCPFDLPFFLVGCGDGTVRLHSTTAEKPLLQLKDDKCKASIKSVRWSRSKPLTIYVLDIDSAIHIWDLGSSDMFPAHSVPTKNSSQLNSIEMSPCRTTHQMNDQYMALGSDDGRVQVHRLNKDFHYSNKAATNREINTFLRYVEIL